MKKFLLFTLLVVALLTGRATSMLAQADQQRWAFCEHEGLYYELDLQQKTAILADAAWCKYYLDHNGDMTGFDRDATHEVPQAYRGRVAVPASVWYQGEEYAITQVSLIDKNDDITALHVEAKLKAFAVANAQNLTSLELTNTSSLTSMHIRFTALTSLVIPAGVNVFYAHGNTRLARVSVEPGNSTLSVSDGLVLIGNSLLAYIPEAMEGVVTIPEGVTSCYSENLLEYCTKVTGIVFPSSYSSYSISNLLSGKNDLKLTFAGDSPIAKDIDGFIVSNDGELIYINLPVVEELTIPEGVKSASWAAIERQLSNVKVLNLPSTWTDFWGFRDYNSVIYINGRFPSLQQVNISDANKELCSVNGVIMDASRETLHYVPRCYQGPTAIPASTVTIGASAFKDNKTIEQIVIPENVTKIEDYAFYHCTKLKEIKLPEGLKELGSYVFSHDSLLTSLTIPSTVANIGERLTIGCPMIDKITVEQGSPSFCDIDGVVFTADKTKLVLFPTGRKGSYVIPTGTTVIGKYAFSYCDSLKQITIPDGVEQLGEEAFDFLPCIENLDLPATLNRFSFGCLSGLSNLKRLVIRTSSVIDYYGVAYLTDHINSNQFCTVYVNDNNISAFVRNNINKFAFVALGKPYGIGQVTTYLKGIRVNVVENEIDAVEKNLVSVMVGDVAAVKQDDGTYLAKGLKINTGYGLGISYQVNEKKDTLYLATISTKNIKPSYQCTTTQSTVTLNRCDFGNCTDETATATKKTITIQDREYDCTESYALSLPFTITGLSASSSLGIKYSVTYDDGEVATMTRNVTTQGFNASLTDYSVTPTTLRLHYTYNEIDATPDSILIITREREPGDRWWVYDTLRTSTKENLFTGLVPNKEYSVSGIYLKGKNDKELLSGNRIGNTGIISTFTTPAFTIATETPKIPERGRAIVSALTNAGDGEGHVGFQWIKHNAPSTMNPYEGYGLVFDGTALGQLKNLGSSYYKVRAFYETTTGTRIYAANGADDGWITFDADETSTFEAIIHTYADVSATNTTAMLTGVMIEGSEKVTRQGFEYWEVNADEPENRAHRRVNADVERQTVLITGDNMSAEVTGLTPGTSYAYRAFAETSTGTVYGEECSFKTNGDRPTAIEHLAVEKSDAAGFNVYSLSGTLIRRNATSTDGLPRGVYIIGNRKVFVK